MGLPSRDALYSAPDENCAAGDNLLIDSDIHPVPIHDQVAEYLAEPFRSRYLRGDHGASHPNYYNPNGVMRGDALSDDGRRIEKAPDSMARYFLDAYDIDYAVINPAEAMEHCVSQDAHYSAAARSAGRHCPAGRANSAGGATRKSCAAPGMAGSLTCIRANA